MNRGTFIKYYDPQGQSFGTVPTNGEVDTPSNVDFGQPAPELLHPSANVSSTAFSRSNHNLRPKRIEQPLNHAETVETAQTMIEDTQSTPPAVGRGRIFENQPL